MSPRMMPEAASSTMRTTSAWTPSAPITEVPNPLERKSPSPPPLDQPENPAAVDGDSSVKNRCAFTTPEIASNPRPSPGTAHVQSDEDEEDGVVIDPISRQILERTKSYHGGSRLTANELSLMTVQKPQATQSTPDSQEAGTLRRNVSIGSVGKAPKDKKKVVSLFSRFIGNKKKDVLSFPPNGPTSASDIRALRPETEGSLQSIGSVPIFPAPSSYLKVKAIHRQQKEFDKTFLAQVLLERGQKARRKVSGDEEIIRIGEVPTGPGLPLNRAVWAMSFSKDGRYLAAAGQNKKVRVWAIISSREERAAHEADEEGKNPDQSGIVLNAPVLRTKLVRQYQGHTSSILDLSWSKNNFLLSSSMDKTVRLWHVSRDECLCAFKHHDFVTSIAFHPQDDRFFLAGSLDAKLRLWSIPDKSVAFWANVQDMVTAVGFTPDGKTCIAGCLNGLCLFYDTNKLKLHSQLHVRSARGRNAKGSKITGIDTIRLPPGDPTGDVKLLITSNDSRVRMYNYKDRNLEFKFKGNQNSCSQIHATFSDDGRYVICGSEDKKVYIWPIGPSDKQDHDKRPVEILEAHSAIVTSALLAPAKTRICLAQSGDPIYDLCNPPPVTLAQDDQSSSAGPQAGGRHSVNEQLAISNPPSAIRDQTAEGSPAYLTRHAHPGGRIIVTADYLGQIKVFRQDCAFPKRHFDSYESGLLLSRTRLLGRSSSISARTSLSSARNSISQINLRNPSADQIISWRNSVANGTTLSPISIDANKTLHRAHSDAPSKGSASSQLGLQPSACNPPSLTTMSTPSCQSKSSDESTSQHIDNVNSTHMKTS